MTSCIKSQLQARSAGAELPGRIPTRSRHSCSILLSRVIGRERILLWPVLPSPLVPVSVPSAPVCTPSPGA